MKNLTKHKKNTKKPISAQMLEPALATQLRAKYVIDCKHFNTC